MSNLPAGTALGVATKLKLQLHDVSNFYCGVLAWRDEPGHATYRWAGSVQRVACWAHAVVMLASSMRPAVVMLRS